MACKWATSIFAINTIKCNVVLLTTCRSTMKSNQLKNSKTTEYKSFSPNKKQKEISKEDTAKLELSGEEKKKKNLFWVESSFLSSFAYTR